MNENMRIVCVNAKSDTDNEPIFLGALHTADDTLGDRINDLWNEFLESDSSVDRSSMYSAFVEWLCENHNCTVAKNVEIVSFDD